MKETIVSGIRATGKLHIGNYLGALKQFVELQNSGHNCFFFIADLHAITTPFEPKDLSQNTLEVAAEYLAAGIDPGKSTFFLQSHVQEHAELAWIFSCLTQLSELYRMTQFKEKLDSFEKNNSGSSVSVDPVTGKKSYRMKAETGYYNLNKPSGNAGLLMYPTLMAADILLYKPTGVPVGEDQVQHVELTRDIAKKFNNRFGKIFPEPKFIMRDSKVSRIKSLKDPSKKMSKTGDEALMLDDNPDEISRKLKKAVTGTDTEGKNPGAENLIYILNHFGTEEDKTKFGSDQEIGKIKYSELKEVLAKRIADNFADFRKRKAELMASPSEITKKLTQGATKARQTASQTLAEVKQKIGLI